MKKKNEHSFTRETWFSEAILDNMQESLIVTDISSKIVYVNSATERLFGYTREEMMGQMPSFVNAEPNIDAIQKDILETLLRGEQWRGQLLNKKKNGDLFTIELTICSLENPEGNLIGFIGYQKDISEKLAAKEGKKESEDKFEKVFLNSPLGMHLWELKDNNDLIFIDSNFAADRFTGIDNSKLYGRTIEEAFPGLVGKEQPEQYRLIAKNGGEYSSTSYSYKDNHIDGVYDIWAFQISKNKAVVQFTEVSEQKKIQLELEHRNQELEQFAYAASHDLQEPLRVVSNYCEMLRDKCINSSSHDKEAEKWMTYIIDATGRMQSLIKELLDYSRVGRKDKPFEKCSIKEIINEATSDFEILIRENNATIIAENNMPEINCIKFRIRQLFHNLLSNAIKFRGKKDPVINIAVCDEGDFYLFCIKDNGLGISPKYFDRIFGIFKRLYSREEYLGTGIGLALCKKIVEAHNGRIWVDSDENKGAAFYFTLAKNIENI